MKYRFAFLFIAAGAIVAADQLTLTDGRRITGSFLDGNARTIRFVAGDAIKTYSASDVVTIRLGEAPADPPTRRQPGTYYPRVFRSL